MPRPRKGRRICCLPRVNAFGPINSTPEGEIQMSVDEYEAIRLLDLEGLTQEEAAERMQVARTTVQRIYAAARHKVAQALFAGSILRIEGGDYEFYPDGEFGLGCSRCGRGLQQRHRRGHGYGAGRGAGPWRGRGWGRP